MDTARAVEPALPHEIVDQHRREHRDVDGSPPSMRDFTWPGAANAGTSLRPLARWNASPTAEMTDFSPPELITLISVWDINSHHFNWTDGEIGGDRHDNRHCLYLHDCGPGQSSVIPASLMILSHLS